MTDYLEGSGLQPYLDQLRFQTVGYGCTTCIGNSGPLPESIGEAHRRALAGDRGGAERQPELRGAGPPAGPRQLPRLTDAGGGVRAGGTGGHRPRAASRSAPARTASRSSSRDIWPSPAEIRDAMAAPSSRSCSTQPLRLGLRGRRGVAGAAGAGGKPVRVGPELDLRRRSRRSSRTCRAEPGPLTDISRRPGAGRPGRLGHHRPHLARRLDPQERAGRALPAGARRRAGWTGTPSGSRRGNHEVMMRGTFGNVRIKNALVPGQGRQLDRSTSRPAR